MDQEINLIDELLALPGETEWVEFKMNHESPENIGEYISALSNSACLHFKSEAFLIFGVENKTHIVKGTSFKFDSATGKGAEPLETWLIRHLKPSVDFKVKTINHPKGRLVVFFIPPAQSSPVKFLNKAWIRIGSIKKSLEEFPEKEAVIWERRLPFEDKIARSNVSDTEVLDLLNSDQYFRLVKESPRPRDQRGIIEKLIGEGFVVKKKGRLNISNLGAILLAQNISDFPNLKSRAIRIITYKGINRLVAIKDITGNKGYAVGFENIISYIQSQVPEPEIISKALRETKDNYPEASIREFVANALVHQDFSIKGSAPLIEIFENRIEISNPGTPLIEPDRFMDHPPLSRNEKMSDRLRRMKICEKRGSGIDRAVLAIEMAQLPAPKIEKGVDSVKVTIYSYKKASQLTKEEQHRACYFHSCVKYILEQDALTNASFCKRLGIGPQNKAVASRIIKDALEKRWIKPFDPKNKSNRYRKYIPYWA